MPEQEVISQDTKKQEEDELRLKQEQEEKERLSGKEQAEKLSEMSENITEKHTEHKIQNPVLASKEAKLQLKIAKLQDKNAILEDKIKKNKGKIEQWRAKIEDRTRAKAYYKELLDTTALPKPLQAFIQARYDRQDEKIKALSAKISIKQDKNNALSAKISRNNKKIEKHTQKIARLQKTDKFIQNLSTKDGRRENFVEGLQELRQWSLDQNTKKAKRISAKIEKKELALSKTTTAAEAVKLRNQIQRLKEKQSVVEDKISKLTVMVEKLNGIKLLPDEHQEQLSEAAAEKVKEAIENNQTAAPDKISEAVLDAAEAVIDDPDNFIEPQLINPDYVNDIVPPIFSDIIEKQEQPTADKSAKESILDQAVKFATEAGEVSKSTLQRRFRIGFEQAGNLIDQMEKMGILGPQEGSKPRQVIKSADKVQQQKGTDERSASSVFSRKKMTERAAKIHQQKPQQPQKQKTQTKNSQSL